MPIPPTLKFMLGYEHSLRFPWLHGVRGHNFLSREGWQRLPQALLNRSQFESECKSPVDYTLDLIRTLSSHQVSRGDYKPSQTIPFLVLSGSSS